MRCFFSERFESCAAATRVWGWAYETLNPQNPLNFAGEDVGNSLEWILADITRMGTGWSSSRVEKPSYYNGGIRSHLINQPLHVRLTSVKAHRSAAGSKKGRKRLGARAAEERAKSMLWPMIVADRSPSP